MFQIIDPFLDSQDQPDFYKEDGRYEESWQSAVGSLNRHDDDGGGDDELGQSYEVGFELGITGFQGRVISSLTEFCVEEGEVVSSGNENEYDGIVCMNTVLEIQQMNRLHEKRLKDRRYEKINGNLVLWEISVPEDENLSDGVMYIGIKEDEGLCVDIACVESNDTVELNLLGNSNHSEKSTQEVEIADDLEFPVDSKDKEFYGLCEILEINFLKKRWRLKDSLRFNKNKKEIYYPRGKAKCHFGDKSQSFAGRWGQIEKYVYPDGSTGSWLETSEVYAEAFKNSMAAEARKEEEQIQLLHKNDVENFGNPDVSSVPLARSSNAKQIDRFPCWIKEDQLYFRRKYINKLAR